MKWSVSTSKVFQQCPKKWYYRTVFADSNSRNPLRSEAYVLKQLQSVHAWRGKVVDQTITMHIVPKLNAKQTVNKDEILRQARALFDAQLAFAERQEYRNGAKKTQYDYCALYELEYGTGLGDEILQTAKAEVDASLTNLLDSSLMKELSESSHLSAQRRLQFQFANTYIECTPDLIAFFDEKPPLIVDWKVLSGYHREHWLQLGIYAVALSRVKPHRDFPEKWVREMSNPLNIRLLEFQLLRKRELPYVLTKEDIVDIEDYIYTSSVQMEHLLNGGARRPEQYIETVPTTRYPGTCAKCSFKKICWGENKIGPS